jgi:hypothetical protein
LRPSPGNGNELAAFPEADRALAFAEEGTVTGHAFKISDTSYGIVDTFGTEDTRDAHLAGQTPKP